MVGRIRVLYSLPFAISTTYRPINWLDELEYYTQCHLQLVLKIVQPLGGRFVLLICISVEHVLNTFRVRNTYLTT